MGFPSTLVLIDDAANLCRVQKAGCIEPMHVVLAEWISLVVMFLDEIVRGLV